MVVSGDYMYSALSDGKVTIVDLRFLPGLSVMGSVNIGSNVYDIEAVSEALFVATGGGIVMIDIRNPNAPSYIRTIEPYTSYLSLASDGMRLFAGKAASGIDIYDLEGDLISTTSSSGRIADIAVEGEQSLCH
jgi:hypothetical protein